MAETLTIPGRFNGPPGSANGGYACGLVAALAGGLAEVTLRVPPPLDRALSVMRNGRVEVRDGDALVAEAVPLAELPLEIPEPVSVEDAELARERYSGFVAHAYSTCFVCGPDREDGLGIFPGLVKGREVVAAPWSPPADVPDVLVWAALDCPSGWAVDEFSRSGVLLGRLAARIVEPVVGGEQYVVAGWPIGADGRKRFAGSAVYGADGSVHAYARSTWLVPASA